MTTATTKRINHQDAPKSFRAAEKIPTRHVTRDGQRCCLLTAMYLDAFGDPGTELARTRIGRSLGLDRWYVSGLMLGWDGFREEDATPELARHIAGNPGRWRDGNRDGLLAWLACEREGLTQPDPEPRKASSLPAYLRKSRAEK